MQHGYGVKGKRVLLVGYFGYGNMGDEAALDGAIRALRERELSVTVCYAPSGDFSDYLALGADSCDRFSPRGVLRAVSECDAVIFSGGNHFENESSRRSLVYYSSIALAATRHSKPLLMLASGLGEMRRGPDRALAMAALGSFSFAGLRTEGDLAEGRDIFRCETAVMPDLTFALGSISGKKAGEVAIIPRKDSAVMLKDAMALRALGLRPVVIPLFIREDARASRGFGETLGCEVFVSQDVAKIRERLAMADLTLTERLHGAVFSLTTSTPFVLYSEAKKCRRFTDEVDKRAKKLDTPSPVLKNPLHFVNSTRSFNFDFSAICSDLRCELASSLDRMLSRALLC